MCDPDNLRKAKIPCKETGIEIRRTICSICEPLFHCGIDAYIKDDKVIKIEGTREHPFNRGLLCTKGLCNREYIYRDDRIKTPLRRVGSKGSSQFEPITWDKAYETIADNLLAIRTEYGPQAVSFFCGYSKWYRAFLHRLAYDFGSPNFGTESSTCHTATIVAWKTMVGRFSGYDVANASTFMAWAVNPYHSKPLELKKLYAAKERGLKVVAIDPRITPTVTKLSDIHLRIKPGTDGALALGMANLIIENDWLDHDYIEHHVYGFEEYARYTKNFDLKRVCEITGANRSDIIKATEWYANNKPSCISQSGAAIVHHRNGFQNFRAIMSLCALTGNYDIKGGNIPLGNTYSHQWADFYTREDQFIRENRPKNVGQRIGAERFPLWHEVVDEDQSVDMARHIIEDKPYPIKAMVAFGLNHRMFPSPKYMLKAIDKLDFVVSVDLFMTDICRHSDIVLPACSSFERNEFKVYPGGFATYTKPVINPLYESKPDTTIIQELAAALDIDDSLIRSGYEKCVRWILENCELELNSCIENDLPVKVPDARPYLPGEYSNTGYDTSTGKFELYSSVVEKYKDFNLDPLPTYSASFDDSKSSKFPFILTSGARLPHTLHTRLHNVAWARSLRPNPMADISEIDARRMGIARGDLITVANENGAITVTANPTAKILPGNIHMYHGY
ncbi:molybdopterin-dependent oxidoreductase, partial [Chloroflexota bacterium]